MALIDCMNKLGRRVSDDDKALLQQWIDQGLTDDQVLDRYDLHIEKKLVDITKLAQEKGAKVSVKRDVLAEVSLFGRAQLVKAKERLTILRGESQILNEKMAEIAWVEGNIKHWEPGGPDIDIYNDGALLVRFHQMLFPVLLRQTLKSGQFGNQQIRGEDAYELRDSFRAMQQRGDSLRQNLWSLFQEEVELVNQIDSLTGGRGITLDPDTGEYLAIGLKPPDKPPGVSEESWSYSFSTEAPKPPFTIKTGKGAEGDLYIQRVGPNAGTPHRTRQGPSDMAISFNKDLLLPDYMFYFLQAIQPAMLARAHGTAQQAINKRDVEEVITETFKRMQVGGVKERGPQDVTVFSDPAVPAATRRLEADANYKAIVRNVEDKTISVGIDVISDIQDVGHVVAEIRKNAQESVWVVVADDAGKVLSIIEHTKGDKDASAVFPSILLGAIHGTEGAKRVWFAHNHPTGNPNPSQPDIVLTENTNRLLRGSGIELQGHVILAAGSQSFTHLGPNGTELGRHPIRPAARGKKISVTKRVLSGTPQRGAKMGSPAEAITVLDSMGNPNGVLMLNTAMEAIGFISMTVQEMEQLRGTGVSARLFRAFGELNAANWIVSTDSFQPTAANNMMALGILLQDNPMLDAMYVDPSGTTKSMAERQELAPPTEFYQTVRGLHSGAMVAAQTMPQSKGTVAQMMAVLKNQPGVTKSQKLKFNEDGTLATDKNGKQLFETTYPELDFIQLEEFFVARGGTVTQDEIIAYIRQNGIRLEETLYGGPTIQEPDLDTARTDVAELYDRYDLEFDDPEGSIVFVTTDFHSQRSYEIIYDPQMGTAAATPDEGATWIHVPEPSPHYLRLANQDQQIAAVMVAEEAIKHDIKDRERGAYAGPSQWAGTNQVLPGAKFVREILLRTPKVPTGGVVHSGNLVLPGGQIFTNAQVDLLMTDVAANSEVGDVRVSRITNDVGEIIQVMYEDLAPENYSDFALLMTSHSLQMTDEQNNLAEVRAKLSEGAGDPILQRQIENYEGGHWAEANVLAHIRLSDRIGPNGEKILFIEELQSSPHQRGSRVGYREAVPDIPNFTIEETEGFWVPKGADGKDLRYGEGVLPIRHISKADNTMFRARTKIEMQLAQKRTAMLEAQAGKEVQLPFKGNAWVSLAIKRVIRMAAEEGYDQIGFITGEQQAVRNGQASSTSEISWDPIREQLQMLDQDGNLTVSVHAAEENLIDHMGLQRVNELKAIVQEKNNLYDIHKSIEVDLDLDPVGLEFAEDEIDINDYDANDLADLAERGELFTAVDINGEYIRAFGGDVIIALTRDAMQLAVNEELFPEDSADLPTLTGLTDVTMSAAGEGNVKFYDSTSPRLTQKAARKLDRKAEVRLNGTEIHTRDGAPFTIELQKTVRPGMMDGVDWFLVNDEGRQVAGPFANEERARNKRDELNDISQTIHVMDITDEMAEAAMEGMTFYQKKRGAISFDMARRGLIKLTETRDLSTFMHEAGHLYLEIMGHLATLDTTPEVVKNDYAKILEYLGVSSREEIGTKQHEFWAESFEKYLQEGRAPSVALQSAFNAYRRWLTEIWKRMKGDSPDGIILTPEIRDVMDRILASDDQIAVAHATQEFAAVFSTAEQMGVTQREFDVYKASIVKATNEAVEKETTRLMAAANRENKAWWKDELAKVRAVVEAEAWEMQVYKAFSLLAHGKQPNGEPLEQGSPFKIDKESLLDLLEGSKNTLKRLPKPWVYTVKNGVDVNIAAKQLGYSDGKALVKALMEMPNMNDWIDVTAEERLNILFPDPMLDGSVSEEAIKAVHNEARLNVLATEMRELRRLMKEDAPIVRATKQDIREQDTLARLANRGILPKKDELKLIKAVARDTIAKLRVMDVRPEVYLNAERKAGRLAFEAAARGDYQKAYNFKRQQTVNHELYRAAVRAKDKSLKARNYLAKFSKPRVQQRLGKLGVLDPILAVLEGIELKKVTLKKINERAALQKLAQQIHDGQIVTPMAEFLYRVEVDDKGNETVILNEAPFKNWQELTVDELQAMRDIVKQLEHQGSRKLEMEVNGEMVVMDEAINELTEQILEVNEPVEIGVGEKTGKKERKQMVDSGFSHWLSPSVMGRMLDKQGWGATTRLVIVTIRRAISEKLVPMQQKAIRDVSEIYLKHYAKGTLGWNDRDMRQLKKKNFVIINGENLSKSDVLSIALQMGNEGNKSALFNGVRIDGKIAYPEDQVRAALELLDARDWAFVQDIWDYLDSYWPAISELEKERRGIAPERIESTPFTVETSDGQIVNMKGGYYPLRYNYEHSERHEQNLFEDHYKSMGNGVYVSASTRASATHNRTKNHNMVVQLGLFTIDRHLKEITRDIAIGNEVNFVKNLLNDKGYRRAMKQTGNGTMLRELTLWLTDAAVGELPANNLIERGMAHTRIGFTMSKLAWNVYTTVLQLTGIFQSMVVIGTKNMAMGAGRVMRNPVSAWRDAFKASAFLRARYGEAKVFDPNIQDAIGVLKEYGPGLPTTGRRSRRMIARSFFWPIAKMQQMVDIITWWGSIWKAKNELGHGDREAALYADAQVELAQTSGFFSDRSGIERGTLSATTRQNQFIRLWTTLISYMQRKGNLAYMLRHEHKDSKGFIPTAGLAMDMILLFTLEGIASAMIYGRWDWEEDDPAEILMAALKETALSIAAGIPFVRELPVAAYGSGNTPVGALTNDLYTLYIQSVQGEMDPALRKAFVNSMGTIFHLPASQTNRMLEALIDEDDPELLEYLTGTRD